MTQPQRTVEVGHTYSPNRLVQLSTPEESDFYSTALGRHFKDTPEAAQLRELASSFGEATLRVALVDDVIPKDKQRKSADSWRWQMFMNASAESVVLGTGITQSELYYESNFEAAGRDLVAQIQTMTLPEGYRLSQAGDKLKIGSGKAVKTIRLQGYTDIEDPTFPSCEVLDLAWLQKRLSLAPEAVTVLPEEFADQQERVAVLASLIGIDPSTYSTVFVNS
jgi:hypothetical protein